ncbi:MOSC domain-containing protein [Actinoplanes friuliensis]|nr:MOSC domain-containing protein [Actinoplanes friuliensis]
MDGHEGEPGMQGAVAAVSCNDVYSFTKPTRGEITLVAGLGVVGDVHAGVTVRHRSRVATDPQQPNLRQVHLIHAELHDEVRPEGHEVPAGGLGENVTTTGIDLLGLPVGTILHFDPPAGSVTTSVPAAPAAPRFVADGLFEVEGPPGGAAVVLEAAAKATLEPHIAPAVAILAARIEAADQSGATEEQPGDRADGESQGPAVIIAGLRNPCVQIDRYQPGLLKQVLGRSPDGRIVRKAGVMAVVLRGGTIRPGDAITVDLPPGPHVALDRV